MRPTQHPGPEAPDDDLFARAWQGSRTPRAAGRQRAQWGAGCRGWWSVMSVQPGSVSDPQPGADPATRWREDLGRWALPSRITAAVEESPWAFSPAQFEAIAEASLGEETPSKRAALETLRPGDTVLDVGAGGGAASLRLAPPAARIVAVDESPEMLEVFTRGAERRGIASSTVLGRWPDVADEVPHVGLAVCHNVVYNVGNLVDFLEALTAHAERRVVELTAEHPQASLNDLWWHFHRLERPERPTAPDFLAVLDSLGYSYEAVSWSRAPRSSAAPVVSGGEQSRGRSQVATENSAGGDPAPVRVVGEPQPRLPDPLDVDQIRRRLCLDRSRTEELAALLANRSNPDRSVVTVSW